ncbi:MAG: type IV toxin-antitoxin system AbiEi family antitoxin [Saprospiraceae bacterium]|nr:type IV toxin-antitoxin system AbiEi family antitoxin [Saprospiraceae bacterium]MDZ4706260.1 type IV toxin-antitoxin system AbiEi family antitoxin [Saprospiraceae bacterium]
MQQEEIVHTALETLQTHALIKGKWSRPSSTELDGNIELTIDNQKLKFNIKITKELQSHQLQQIINLSRQDPSFLLVAARLLPKTKEQFRHLNIAYLEANGNIYLKHEQIFVWIEANKPLVIEVKKEGRAFTKTGLKVVFEFLLDETWLNKPYRQIANYTGTAIGNITNILQGLKQEGLLLPLTKKQYSLQDKEMLIKKWAMAYDIKLKPSLRIGTFRFLKEADFINWKNLSLQNGKTWWSGEPAGDIYTNYLRPAELTLYTTETRNELIKNYRLIPDEKGNVKIYKKFWQYNDLEEHRNVVPPLLAYADLINTNDRRCLETAQKIYDAFLQNKLRTAQTAT